MTDIITALPTFRYKSHVLNSWERANDADFFRNIHPGTSLFWDAVRELALLENAHRDALMIQRDLDHATALAQNNERPATPEEVTEATAVRKAEGLGASPEQLTRLRALIQSERELMQLKRKLNEPEEITAYDERIRPMLVDLAHLAEERGFCSEFDLVLEHIGAPSRAELGGGTPGHVHVDVTISVTVDVEDTENVDLSIGEVREAVFQALRDGDDLSYETGTTCTD
jgi:hypothetical protein